MKFKEGSVSDVLFQTLVKASDYSLFLEDFTYSGQMKSLKRIPNHRTKNTVDVAILRLKKKGIIKLENDFEGRILISLTDFGREYVDSNSENWDGKFRIVMWDIPERKRRIRNLFRRKLKEWKFVQWQKSVWVSKRNVTVKLREMINEYEMGQWVSVIESDDPFLQSLFQ